MFSPSAAKSAKFSMGKSFGVVNEEMMMMMMMMMKVGNQHFQDVRMPPPLVHACGLPWKRQKLIGMFML